MLQYIFKLCPTVVQGVGIYSRLLLLANWLEPSCSRFKLRSSQSPQTAKVYQAQCLELVIHFTVPSCDRVSCNTNQLNYVKVSRMIVGAWVCQLILNRPSAPPFAYWIYIPWIEKF